MIRFDVDLDHFFWSTTLASYNFIFLSLGQPAATLPTSPRKHQSKHKQTQYLTLSCSVSSHSCATAPP